MSRVVLVTGCTTGGIGYALCEEFANQGCKVYATSRRVETIADFKTSNVEKLALDVTSDESVKNVFEHIVQAEGKIDIVVNNAGMIGPGPLIDQSIEYVQKMFDTNTYSVLRVCKSAIPIMAKRNRGLIVNIGSVVGETATPWNGLYSASKAAVKLISDVLTMECKPFNIDVLHVAPGSVKSNISNNASGYSLPPDSLYGAFLPNIIARLHSSQGPGSMPSADFARVVVSKALRKKPPQYLTAGGKSTMFTIFRWLPRGVVFYLMWRVWGKKM